MVIIGMTLVAIAIVIKVGYTAWDYWHQQDQVETEQVSR